MIDREDISKIFIMKEEAANIRKGIENILHLLPVVVSVEVLHLLHVPRLHQFKKSNCSFILERKKEEIIRERKVIK